MHQSHFHPDTASARKMTPAQEDLLRRVVKSNGGGVSSYGEADSIIKGLIDRHLVQGKAGSPSTIVHTRQGLDWVRANPKQ